MMCTNKKWQVHMFINIDALNVKSDTEYESNILRLQISPVTLLFYANLQGLSQK